MEEKEFIDIGEFVQNIRNINASIDEIYEDYLKRIGKNLSDIPLSQMKHDLGIVKEIKCKMNKNSAEDGFICVNYDDFYIDKITFGQIGKLDRIGGRSLKMLYENN